MTGWQMSTCENFIKHDIEEGAKGQYWLVLQVQKISNANNISQCYFSKS